MKDLYIVGAGGFGRELLGWLRQHPDCWRLWQPAGFVDDNPAALHGFGVDLPVVGAPDAAPVDKNSLFVCALGRPEVKRRIIGTMRGRGAAFVTFVHPSAVVGERVRIGEGSVLCPGVILTCDITVGDFVLFNCGASAGHDTVVGAYTSVSGHVDLTSRTRLGADVFVGSHAVIIPGVEVEQGAVIGAGAIVVSPVKPGLTVFGNPARPFAP
ncbi:MAG: acetyltransferase [Opitutales bacterium]|nr:acetyltransferase [Opitutales bacterium]